MTISYDLQAPQIHVPMSYEEFIELPEDAHCEIVDGILRPMTTPNLFHIELQQVLTTTLRAQVPADLHALAEVMVTFTVVPPHVRKPDVLVFRPGIGDHAENTVPAARVELVVEVVSPGSETADRHEKPGEYARNGIPRFWRVEPDPLIVRTFHLVDGVYRPAGTFGEGERIADSGLSWLDIEVDTLRGRYA